MTDEKWFIIRYEGPLGFSEWLGPDKRATRDPLRAGVFTRARADKLASGRAMVDAGFVARPLGTMFEDAAPGTVARVILDALAKKDGV